MSDCIKTRNYKGFKTKEPWYILTNLMDLDLAIRAYQKRFDIAVRPRSGFPT
ncbi:hypothetical protein [Moorena sp. SIO3I6]|uniref:hypothetical protein n=1 Tax=Moorena sp. SIO3I6 TaxID=2607831 RepID=UPI0013FB6743|nr:hypothetical protein [Moorena sp. SIO3I6]NEP28038.1 hypothetical protein [Moorena sp. SIO3I6]